MTTKFDVGQDVLVKARVRHIHVYSGNRVGYDIQIHGTTLCDMSDDDFIANTSEESLQYDICPTDEDSGAMAF